MQAPPNGLKPSSATDQIELAQFILKNPTQYWALLTEVVQTHVLPFYQFHQLHQPECFFTPNSCRSLMRRTVSQAIDMLEIRLATLRELSERLEVASFDAELEQTIAPGLTAESEALD